MFGKDMLTLSRPREIKTVAKSFANNIRNTESPKTFNYEPKILIKEPKLPVTKTATKAITSVNRVQPRTKYEVDDSSINDIEVTIRKGYLKLEVVRPYAKNFLKQVTKLEDISEEANKNVLGEIIFSYSDTKGRWGKLENRGDKIKITLKKNDQGNFSEDNINIYSLKNYNVKPSGVYVQVKGWGNLKELSVLNALKNSLSKLSDGKTEGSFNHDKVIFSYTLSSMSSLADGGWECKVKVIPGKIHD